LSDNLTNSNNLVLAGNSGAYELSRSNIAIFRQYRRGLTRDEAFQNYYATRNRFNI